MSSSNAAPPITLATVKNFRARLQTLQDADGVRLGNPAFATLQSEISRAVNQLKQDMGTVETETKTLRPSFMTLQQRSDDYTTIYAAEYASVWSMALGGLAITVLYVRTFANRT